MIQPVIYADGQPDRLEIADLIGERVQEPEVDIRCFSNLALVTNVGSE